MAQPQDQEQLGRLPTGTAPLPHPTGGHPPRQALPSNPGHLVEESANVGHLGAFLRVFPLIKGNFVSIVDSDDFVNKIEIIGIDLLDLVISV